MFKKITLAAAIAASSSFATYTFFPVGDAHTGQAQITGDYSWGDEGGDWSSMQLKFSAEYVVIPNLELSISKLGYQLWNEPDDYDGDDTDGFMAMTFGARYQFHPMFIAALDLGIPLNADEVAAVDPFELYGAIQFTTDLIPNLSLGSELGFHWYFEDEDVTYGKILTLQAELDYSIPSIHLTPWVGFEYDQRVTDTEYPEVDDGAGDNEITIWVGAQYDISKMLFVKAQYVVCRGDVFGDYMELQGTVGVNF